jgi:endonuclease/exonuclease/phosphatase family metal-dependent hydrolase
MMKYCQAIAFLALFFPGIAMSAYGQSSDSNVPREYRVMFYNLENLFDTYDDPLTRDDEFTPDGAKSWSYNRYQKKLNAIAKVIIAVGEWDPPAVIGLCEVENFQVLLDLATKTPLKSMGYQIIHENSSDSRGIDVAMLYRPEVAKRIDHVSVSLKSTDWTTRDILLARLLFLQTGDTLHFLVNHWPSRYGGKEQTEPRRLEIARLLRHHADSLQSLNPSAKMLIMGDLNDEPVDKSLQEVLKALPADDLVDAHQLYNLAYADFRHGRGTLVFKEINNTWFLFDQIIVSGSLIDGAGLNVKGRKLNIFDPGWILKDQKPFRTYQGPIYKGGFSDHLPIFIDLYLNE